MMLCSEIVITLMKTIIALAHLATRYLANEDWTKKYVHSNTSQLPDRKCMRVRMTTIHHHRIHSVMYWSVWYDCIGHRRHPLSRQGSVSEPARIDPDRALTSRVVNVGGTDGYTRGSDPRVDPQKRRFVKDPSPGFTPTGS